MALEDLTISKDSFEILQPVIVATRIFGVCPIKYVKYGNHYQLEKSLPYMIYSYMLTIVLVGNLYFNILNQHFIQGDHKYKLVEYAQIHVVIIILLWCLMMLPLKLRQLWSLLQNLNQVNMVMPVMETKKFRQYSIVLMTVTFALIVSGIVFNCIMLSIKITWSTSLIVFYRKFIPFCLLQLIMMAQVVLVCHVVLFIKVKIRVLNNRLQCLSEENCNKRISVIRISCNDEAVREHTIEGPSLVEKVTSIIKCQEKIFDSVQSLNDCSAYGIHLTIFNCLLHLITTPYFCYDDLIKEGPNVTSICLHIFWMLIHIGTVLLITEPCQQCVHEHNNTLRLVCQCLSRNFNEDVKQMLKIFAMLLNHRKITFSCCGLFDIDRFLLTSMAAVVVTYVVILIQVHTN